jgi:hypothetical protein
MTDDMSTLIISENAWAKILTDLHTIHSLSVFAIKDNMQRKLGFTPRVHHTWQDVKGIEVRWPRDNPEPLWSISEVHLDFYNENKRMMFEIKYSELIARYQRLTICE